MKRQKLTFHIISRRKAIIYSKILQMKYSEIIRQAEDSFLGSVEDFFKKAWGETDLPSHDLDHHRRVWNYVKEILGYYSEPEINQKIIINLLIASYFHDIGMSEDQGIRHGYRSRMAAESYLTLNRLRLSDHMDALTAIENHDNKEYGNPESSNIILKILSVADDLDAFGSEGITRYLEIYRARGISEESIGYKILENAESRFENFKKFTEPGSELFNIHSIRYNELREYFEGNNRTGMGWKSGGEQSGSDQHSPSSNK